MASSSDRRREGALSRSVQALSRHYGDVRSLAPRDPFQAVIWEYVAYLTDDAERAAAFQVLKKKVGARPAALSEASPALLEAICRGGSAIAPKLRAERIRSTAARVREKFGGSLKKVMALSYKDARRILMSFPAIGPPGADKVLLLAGAHRVLALDSNALRVLLRLGYGTEQKSYAATYQSAQAAATPELKRSFAAFEKASVLLRRHGQELCRRTAPFCFRCPLQAVCPSASSGNLDLKEKR